MPCYHVKSFDKFFYTLKQSPSITDVTKVQIIFDWQADPHSHPCTEILFITGGQGHIMLANTKYRISKGDLVIINPGIIHYEKYQKTVSGSEPFCFYSCVIDDIETEIMPPKYLLPDGLPPILKTGEMEGKFLSLFMEAFEQHMAGEKWYAEICKNICYEIVILTLRLLREKYNLTVQWEIKRNIDEIKQYIDLHITEKINSESIAEALFMSRHTLYRLFKEDGSFLIPYINQKRIELAKRLICDTSESLQDIAYKVGYSDYSYFFTLFKKISHISPNEYRKQFSVTESEK